MPATNYPGQIHIERDLEKMKKWQMNFSVLFENVIFLQIFYFLRPETWNHDRGGRGLNLVKSSREVFDSSSIVFFPIS